MEPLPKVLLGESPTVKLLWLWLLPQGKVSFSQREIADALNVSQGSVSLSLSKLIELGFAVRHEAGARISVEAVEPREPLS